MSNNIVALVRQAIFNVLDEREWNFSDDEQRVDFADRVLTFIPIDSQTVNERAESTAVQEHIQTERCGFDRNASISEDQYVCECGKK